MLLTVVGLALAYGTAGAKGVLKVGDKAPYFELRGNDGKLHRLSDFKGEYVVLYFYPKDETPGCTTEACSFRDDIMQIKKAGAQVLGVSVDDVSSHKEFTKKYGLNFILLADPEKKVVKEYGVLSKRGYAERVTFIINPDGKIAKIYPNVNPEGHSKEVLSDLHALNEKK
ncbi:MAG: peroxiredoxin [Candidatus Kryptoniota bacterium]